MFIQGNQPRVANLKWLQLVQELFYLKQLAFSVWKEHTMRARRSGIGHLLYKQTGYDRCDSSNCLYSLLRIKYGFNTLGKKCWLNMEEIACLFIVTGGGFNFIYWLCSSETDPQQVQPPLSQLWEFFHWRQLLNRCELCMQTSFCWAF